MTINLTIAGVVFAYPESEDEQWGVNATDWATKVSNSLLQTTGGAFTLSANVNFGPSFGLLSLFYQSRTALPAAAGQLRLARVDEVRWRNEADGADVKLGVNSSNQLTFEGIPLGTTTSTVSDTATIDMTLSGVDISGIVVLDSLDNTHINSAAAIALSKLATVTVSRALESDGSGFIIASAITAVELNRLSGVTSDVQTQLDAKLADTGTANRVVVTNGSGDRVDNDALSGSKAVATTAAGLLATSTTTSTELDFVAGATSNIQTQIDAAAPPTGCMIACASISVPTGWLLADGTDVSRTTFAALFTAIGTAYGVGDGSTTFNLPDLRSSVPVGKNTAVSDFDALGKSAGEKDHTLTIAEMPAHIHDILATFFPGDSANFDHGAAAPQAADQPSLSTGGDGAHNNMPPYVIINWIIKT